MPQQILGMSRLARRARYAGEAQQTICVRPMRCDTIPGEPMCRCAPRGRTPPRRGRWCDPTGRDRAQVRMRAPNSARAAARYRMPKLTPQVTRSRAAGSAAATRTTPPPRRAPPAIARCARRSLPRFGEREPPRGPVQEPRVEVRLQLRDLPRHRGGRQERRSAARAKLPSSTTFANALWPGSDPSSLLHTQQLSILPALCRARNGCTVGASLRPPFDPRAHKEASP